MTTSTQLQPDHPTIGMLLHDMSEYHQAIWSGVADTTREHDVNFITFAGAMLQDPRAFMGQGNILYDLATAESLDGLITVTTLGNFVPQEELEEFCYRYTPLPIVSIGVMLKNLPGVTVDNEKGLHDLLIHLIADHEYRRIAFIKGPEENLEAKQRYQVYTDVLTSYDLPFDPALVVSGDFTSESGIVAMKELLDRNVDFEAVLVSNDLMAFGALKVLQAQGINIPETVAVTGFDDLKESKYTIPPLTTVRQPIYELGCRAVEMILAQLQGEEIPQLETLPTALVVRRSCGCQDHAVMQAAVELQGDHGDRPATHESFKLAFDARRQKLLTEMTQTIETPVESLDANWGERLLETFFTEVTNEASGAFLSTLEEILRRVMEAGGDIDVWQGLISVLRRHTLPCLADKRIWLQAEDLWGQARVLIGEIGQQVQKYQQLQARKQTQLLNKIGRALITTFDVKELLDVLAQELPRLGMPSCYLSLYENPETPTEWSRLMLTYNEADASHPGGRIEVEPGGRRFPSRYLMPEGFLPQERQFNMVLEPLYFREDQIGFILFEVGPREGRVYETLRTQLSGALKGALLLQEHARTQEVLALQPIIEQVMHVSKQLGNTSNELTKISNQMATEAEHTTQQAQTVSSNSQQINQVVHNISIAAKEKAVNLQEISHTVTQVTEIITKAVDVANAANTMMNSLGTHSRQIENIIGTITDIADQTDLLALNATIKAAQAGKLGRGFAVVANEVKTLAYEVSRSAEDIAYKIKMIQTNSQEAAHAITHVKEIIRRISELSNTIETATSEQTTTTSEVSRIITDAARGSSEITRAMTEVATATQDSSGRAAQVLFEAQELAVLAEQLHQLVEEFKM